MSELVDRRFKPVKFGSGEAMRRPLTEASSSGAYPAYRRGQRNLRRTEVPLTLHADQPLLLEDNQQPVPTMSITAADTAKIGNAKFRRTCDDS